MGSGMCNTNQLSSLQINRNLFLSNIQYYDTEIDPVHSSRIQVYRHKQNYLQKKIYHLNSKQKLQQLSSYVLKCARCPSGIQSVVQMRSTNNCKVKCEHNYQLQIYAQHLNFSLKEHFQNLKFKNAVLKTKEILYVLKQTVVASNYLIKRNCIVKSFDPACLYLNANYQIKIPIQNIICNGKLPFPQPKQTQKVYYLSPQQLDEQNASFYTQPICLKTMQASRVFSLGMLILQCITLLDGIVSYYNYNTDQINILKLNNDIKSLKETTIAALLSRMLQIDPRKRIRFKELDQVLSKFQQSMFDKYLTIY